MLCLATQSYPTLCNPMDCSLPSSSVHADSRQEYWSGLPCPPPGDLPNPGIEPTSLTLQMDSWPSEPRRKPKNTGMSSLSFLQGNFPTQELNWGLLHCRQILYQLSYQGSPVLIYVNAYFYIPVFTPISSLFPLINLIPISGPPRWH